MGKVMSKTLTPSEARVVALIVQGKVNKIIAYELGLKEATIKSQLQAAKHRLGVKTLPQLAYQLGVQHGRESVQIMKPVGDGLPLQYDFTSAPSWAKSA